MNGLQKEMHAYETNKRSAIYRLDLFVGLSKFLWVKYVERKHECRQWLPFWKLMESARIYMDAGIFYYTCTKYVFYCKCYILFTIKAIA